MIMVSPKTPSKMLQVLTPHFKLSYGLLMARCVYLEEVTSKNFLQSSYYTLYGNKGIFSETLLSLQLK